MKEYSHGYLLAGDSERAEAAALKMASGVLGQKESALFSHPDFSFIKKNLLAIDDARSVREKSARKSFFGRGRVFVLCFDSLTREAANALLKTLEEPGGGSHFFLITKSLENILGTLRSRLRIMNFSFSGELDSERRQMAEKFLSSSVQKRTELVKGLAEDKNKTVDFLNDLEIVLSKKLAAGFPEKVVDSLEKVAKFRPLLSKTYSSPKMIFEYLSFVLPKT